MDLDTFVREYHKDYSNFLFDLWDGKTQVSAFAPEPKSAALSALPSSSQLGKCRRMVAYKLQGYPAQKPDPNMIRWVEFAKYSHNIIQSILINMASRLKMSCFFETREVFKQKGKAIYTGAPDFVLQLPKQWINIEIKNANPFTYDKMKDGDVKSLVDAKPEYYHQVQAIMKTNKLFTKTWVILAAPPSWLPGTKDFQFFNRLADHKFFEIDKQKSWFNTEFVPWVKPLRKALQLSTLPDPDYRKKDKKSPCRYCPYSNLCEGK